MRVITLMLLPVLALAGCAAESRQAPVSSVGSGSMGSASGAPQSANSLPRGSSVNQPFTPTSGTYGTTTVGRPAP